MPATTFGFKLIEVAAAACTFKGEDEANRQRVDAKNGLENYCFTVRNTLNEEKLKLKLDAGDKARAERAVEETIQWIEKNQLAEKDEFEAKQKELEAIVNPVMVKVYQSEGGPAPPQPPSAAGGGPSVEEVD
ncbi:unnamed protein product [Polarella glacialis]|uniref:Uncharacterized protein n=1 Tax=Polarella glacialis TaxID=89957 RepID=A0A813IJK8_POLGL|nr:unnamed protein product [Polarella glacialis]